MKHAKLFLFLVLLVMVSGSVQAFFPVYHYDVTKRACETYQGSNQLAQTCCSPQYFDYLAAGANLADITVVKYLEKLGAYDATHSWDYCIAMSNDPGPMEERCFALGHCLHDVEDITSHNRIVPYAIKHTFIPNLLIHAPTEYKFDRWAREQGASYADFEDSLEVARCDLANDPSASTPECQLVKKMQVALSATEKGREANVDVYSLTDWYIKSVVTDDESNHGVYTAGASAYIHAIPLSYKIALIVILIFFGLISYQMIKLKKKGRFVKIFLGFTIFLWILCLAGLIAVLMNQIYTFFLAVIYPVSVIAPMENPAVLDAEVINNIHGFFNYGTDYIPVIKNSCETPPCTPSGFNGGGIQQADRVVSIVWIFIIVAMFGYFLFMLAKTFDVPTTMRKMKFKRRRR